jgi:polysaccharide export outer membrane protein
MFLRIQNLELMKNKLFFKLNCLSIAIFMGSSAAQLFAESSIAQTVPSLPQTSQLPTLPSPSTPPPPSQTPPQNFNPGNIFPPEGYSPPPYQDEFTNPFNTYLLDVGDTISVSVERFPEFSFIGIIDPEGYVSMPLLGRISLVGLTVEEVETKISNLLGTRFLKEKPKVNAVLAGPRPVQITLLGEIVRPGYYIFAPGTPLTTILQSAGGSTSTADLRSIILRRPLKDGGAIEQTVDLFTPLQTGERLPNLRLQGGDTIVVSKLQVGQDQDYDRTLVARTALAQQTITIRVLSYPASGIGTINVPNGSTFLDVVGSVAPSPDVANLDEIALVRLDPERGKVTTQYIDAKRAIKGDIAQDVPLQDGDVIVVGRSLIAKVQYALQTVTQPFQSIFSFQSFFERLGNIFD